MRPNLLWTHVIRRTDRHPGPSQLRAEDGLRDTEVAHHDLAGFLEHDVIRLDVAMDHPVFVGVAQSACRLHDDSPDVAWIECRVLYQFRKCRPAEESHGEIDDVARPAHPVDRNDVGVLELGRRPRLLREALD